MKKLISMALAVALLLTISSPFCEIASAEQVIPAEARVVWELNLDDFGEKGSFPLNTNIPHARLGELLDITYKGAKPTSEVISDNSAVAKVVEHDGKRALQIFRPD
ncbi:MAG: hypothetical protein LBH91_01215, partial [Prevotellaceae bacterium]|nr:hypothetical protein [Prevotellaceae bacterium]